VRALARQSTHPYSTRITEALALPGPARAVEGFTETPGAGIQGTVEGHALCLGSSDWLANRGIPVPTAQAASPAPPTLDGARVHLAIDGRYRGAFVLANPLRPDADRLLRSLGDHYEVALLSGDNDRERERFRTLCGERARLLFNQSPLDKLAFVRDLQQSGRTVLMVGDGLNDAGALRQSDVGAAVVEQVGAFSPASDIILEANQVPRLVQVLELARRTVSVVRWCFAISALYNLVGVGIAAAGLFSPVICAILMPLSSVSVVLFACGATSWAARRLGFPARHPAP
jgi:Cu+-exporting ATPase